ncbi:MAG: SurA N-terminal domain-containing protein [Dysgonamonadaceae bacterium]|jgi:peptidyl-prolyl cis-trans isomerase D|nr:SurA N-terminal domain-containing protein [Dysgonamonadaceae bacterium]
MATLEKIRNNAKWALIIFIGLAMFAFVFDGFFRSGSVFFNRSKENVIIVNGETVKAQDYQARVERMVDAYKNQYPNINDQMTGEIREQVYNQLVGVMLLDQECEKTGITVGKDELYDMVVGNNISEQIQQIPSFQNQQTGRFDKNLLLQFLQTIESNDLGNFNEQQRQQIETEKENWANVEKSVSDQKKLMKLNALVSAALVTNSLEAKAEYEENAVSASFQFVSAPFASIPDSTVQVSDSEIKKLYDLRKSSLKQPGGKVVDYIAVAVNPSQDDYKQAKDDIDKVRAELETSNDVADIVNEKSDVPFLDVYTSAATLSPDLAAFMATAAPGAIDGPVLNNDVYSVSKLIDTKTAPDSIKFSMLMLPSMADDAELIKIADSLINIVKGGKTFSEMVLEATNGQGNGDMGWYTEASLAQRRDAKFAEELFNAPLNEAFILKSSLGNQIVQVVEKTKPVKKYKIGTVQIKVTASSATTNNLYNDLNHYISTNNKLESFKANAADAGYICQTNVTLSATQYAIANIDNSRQAVRWAFNHSKGEISEIIECQDYFVVVAVEGSLREGEMSLKEASEALKRELINQKKGEKIVADLKAKNLSGFDAYAQAMNSTPQDVQFVTFGSQTQLITGIGRDPIVNAMATSAQSGIVGPFAGRNAVYVLNITGQTKSEAPYDQTATISKLNSEKALLVMSGLQNFELLKQSAKIEDYRIRYF